MPIAPHPFTLRQLQYVVAVAEELSFRKAADRCRVSQPSLSAQIAQLEDGLDVRLFERRGKPVIATAQGREIVLRAKKLLLDANDLAQAAARARDPLTGTLRLGIIPTVSPYLLPSVTPRLRHAFPRLATAWHEEKTEVLMKKLADGSLDGAILALQADVGDVERAVIAEDPFLLVVRPEHPLAKAKAPVTNAELKGEEVLLLDDGHCFRNQALEVCSVSRSHEAEFRATSLTTLVQMVRGGGGITLLPALAVAAETRRAGLRVRPLATPIASRTLALVWRKHSPISAEFRQIAAIVREAYPTPPISKRRSK